MEQARGRSYPGKVCSRSPSLISPHYSQFRLKCNRCNKYKGHTGFSTKQLTDVRAAVKDKGQSANYNIKCMPCTGLQPVEIECTVCCVTKGLEAFAKSQRRRPDIAECFQCTEKRLDVAPYDEQQYVAENRSNAFSAPDESGFQPTIFDVSTPSDTVSYSNDHSFQQYN